MSSMTPNEPGISGPGTEFELTWRSSRHARRLLTLGLFGVFKSGGPAQVLRPQVRVLADGAALLALGAAAGMLPAAGPGAGSALLRLVAAGALIAAAGLVLPYVARGDAPPRHQPETLSGYTRGEPTPGSSLERDGLRPGWAGGKIGLYAD
jgi:hypothetical protein